MTFDPNIPNASQSPGLFPSQCGTNFTALKDIINREHIFNDTPGVVTNNTGTHRQASFTDRTDPVTLPTGTNGMLYSSSGLPRWYNGTSIFAVPVMRAFINFNSVGSVGTPYNATVTRLGIGIYRVNFTVALPSINYQYSVNANSNSNDVWIVCVTSVAVGTMGIRIVNTANNNQLIDPVNPASVSVMIMGG